LSYFPPSVALYRQPDAIEGHLFAA
jgi:hypothetical protein